MNMATYKAPSKIYTLELKEGKHPIINEDNILYIRLKSFLPYDRVRDLPLRLSVGNEYEIINKNTGNNVVFHIYKSLKDEYIIIADFTYDNISAGMETYTFDELDRFINDIVDLI